MWKLLLVAIPVQVIELFGYLIKILCENSSLSLPKLLGYLVEVSEDEAEDVDNNNDYS